MIDSILKKGTFPPVLLFFGEEDLLVEESAAQIFEAAAQLDPSGMNSEIIDGDGISIDAILSTAKSFPMLSERRILWVKHFDKVHTPRERKGADKLTEYLSDPMASTILILTSSIPSANGIHASMKKNEAAAKKKITSMKYPTNVLLSKTSWIEFPQMREPQVASWLTKRATGRGLRLTSTVTESLIAQVGISLRDLDMELSKLSEYLGGRDVVTEDDVLEVVGTGRQYNVFELQRSIGKRDVALAMKIMMKMLESSRQELLIITMLTRYFFSLFKIVECRSLSSNTEIARIAGIPLFAVGEYLSAADHLGTNMIDRALFELRRAEAEIKSSSTDPTIILQTMIVRMFEETIN
ncbi:MAG: DNA polymerase III subunit delta [Ignavibacteria bacterium]|nr:DNA polymerase III subunit delta [Ignavibacteria bacterium]